MSNVKNNASAQETRRRLLEAAGQVFARRGLHGATTREITDLAHANSAAINYHFKDKQELYFEVMRYGHARAIEGLHGIGLTGPPQKRLRQFVAHMMRQVLDPARPEWAMGLFWREHIQPTAALDVIIDLLARPYATALRGILADLMGKKQGDPRVILAANSIISQCVFYVHHRALLDRLYPDVPALHDARVITRHITQNALAAYGPRPARRRTGAKTRAPV
jgi:AcrR family transcriptional regulator